MEQPYIPQPQPIRGRAARPMVRLIVVALLAAALSALGTFIAYAKYAQEHLYTEAEALEIMQGVAKAVGERAFQYGRQQKCERNI